MMIFHLKGFLKHFKQTQLNFSLLGCFSKKKFEFFIYESLPIQNRPAFPYWLCYSISSGLAVWIQFPAPEVGSKYSVAVVLVLCSLPQTAGQSYSFFSIFGAFGAKKCVTKRPNATKEFYGWFRQILINGRNSSFCLVGNAISSSASSAASNSAIAGSIYN